MFTYQIYLSNNGLKVFENSKEILRSNTPLVIRDYRKSEDGVKFNVITDKEKVSTLEVGSLEELSYEVKIGTKTMKTKAKEGKIPIQFPATPEGLDIKILRV